MSNIDLRSPMPFLTRNYLKASIFTLLITGVETSSSSALAINSLAISPVKCASRPASSANVSNMPKETWVNIDKDKIEQVFNNFISNSIKYSPPNTTIYIACVAKGNYAYVSVKDEGMGIRPEDQEKLFERFYRVNRQDTNPIAGFGIGLYICKEIIERHYGQIGVESTPGKGSTFWFTLPMF